MVPDLPQHIPGFLHPGVLKLDLSEGIIYRFVIALLTVIVLVEVFPSVIVFLESVYLFAICVFSVVVVVIPQVLLRQRYAHSSESYLNWTLAL